MQESMTEAQALQLESTDILTEILHQGAQKMLAKAIQHEVDQYVTAHDDLRDAAGRRLVVRNGSMPRRSILTGLGPVEIRQPRVYDKRMDEHGHRIRFTSKILPPYLRRTQSIDELIPWKMASFQNMNFTRDCPQVLISIPS